LICREIVAESGIAKLRSRFDERLEHGFKIERRTTDDLEHIGSGGLLLQRFGKVGGALAQFVE
jgi:hypothetical protein